MVTLRPAGVEDAQQIRAFIRQEGLNPFGLDWRRFTVAETETGRLVGCVQYKPHRPDIVELASLVVDPQWRGKGMGKALVTHLQQVHGPPLWLMCAGQTSGFYVPFGFVTIIQLGEMPPYFRRIARISNWASWLFRPENRLAIMVWR